MYLLQSSDRLEKRIEDFKMSFDLGVMMHERDRKRATHLFKRTPSIGTSIGKSASLEGEHIMLGNFEPDWSKFEQVYARGEPRFL